MRLLLNLGTRHMLEHLIQAVSVMGDSAEGMRVTLKPVRSRYRACAKRVLVIRIVDQNQARWRVFVYLKKETHVFEEAWKANQGGPAYLLRRKM